MCSRTLYQAMRPKPQSLHLQQQLTQQGSSTSPGPYCRTGQRSAKGTDPLPSTPPVACAGGLLSKRTAYWLLALLPHLRMTWKWKSRPHLSAVPTPVSVPPQVGRVSARGGRHKKQRYAPSYADWKQRQALLPCPVRPGRAGWCHQVASKQKRMAVAVSSAPFPPDHGSHEQVRGYHQSVHPPIRPPTQAPRHLPGTARWIHSSAMACSTRVAWLDVLNAAATSHLYTVPMSQARAGRRTAVHCSMPQQDSALQLGTKPPQPTTTGPATAGIVHRPTETHRPSRETFQDSFSVGHPAIAS